MHTGTECGVQVYTAYTVHGAFIHTVCLSEVVVCKDYDIIHERAICNSYCMGSWGLAYLLPES